MNKLKWGYMIFSFTNFGCFGCNLSEVKFPFFRDPRTRYMNLRIKAYMYGTYIPKCTHLRPILYIPYMYYRMVEKIHKFSSILFHFSWDLNGFFFFYIFRFDEESDITPIEFHLYPKHNKNTHTTHIYLHYLLYEGIYIWLVGWMDMYNVYEKKV